MRGTLGAGALLFSGKKWAPGDKRLLGALPTLPAEEPPEHDLDRDVGGREDDHGHRDRLRQGLDHVSPPLFTRGSWGSVRSR
jgi:hypothetical protein